MYFIKIGMENAVSGFLRGYWKLKKVLVEPG
jgi:hypothetical protein